MKYVEFLEKQDKIYSEFRDTLKIKVEGLKPNIEENKGGYIIALKHSDNIINNISNITSKIYKEIACIKYDGGNIHTTLATYNECIGFKANKEELELIANIAENNISLIKDVKINYLECLMNQDTVIVEGYHSIEANTSAYIKDNETLLLIDCGETVFKKILEKSLMAGVKQVHILITHMHLDHIGSLGGFIEFN
ncbi:MBL fold metallo-hydrolase [Clostridium lundense]|uniref:MBL fold metallo-hydrolase n=1 Tax=Clostridium lundense TaxID=319475 RepID=UPI0004876E32|nr:MBL fold metallo-hydrolase [Clostridium lundense]